MLCDPTPLSKRRLGTMNINVIMHDLVTSMGNAGPEVLYP